jgi:transcriptional regulator with XRE-family HTH domain
MEPQPPLTAYRTANGLTLRGLADKLQQEAGLEISEGHLSRVEREGTANFRLALKLAELTQLPVETFRPTSEAAGRAA